MIPGRVGELFEVLAGVLSNASKRVDGGQYREAIRLLIDRKGKIVVIGVGKSGDIGKKIASTFTSLGSPTIFVHPSDAMHGDLGLIETGDIAIAISHSGETDELVQLLPYLRERSIQIIAITGREKGTLAKASAVVLLDEAESEICPLNLAPTTSSLMSLVIGDVLAVLVAEATNVSKEKFARNHPSGALGRRLTLRVRDLMMPLESDLLCGPETTFFEALPKISSGKCGAICVANEGNEVLGLVTDGDIRRALQTHKNDRFHEKKVGEFMTKSPAITFENEMAYEALDRMEQRTSPISVLPVLNGDKKLVGVLRLHDLVRAGL